MTPTPDDYWRDGVAMAAVDRVPHDVLRWTIQEAETGEQFNNAIWAWSRLMEVCNMPGYGKKPMGKKSGGKKK